MAMFMKIESANPKLRQAQITKEIFFSCTSSKRYRNDIYMVSPYGITLNSHKRRQKTSNEDPNRSQITSKDLNWPQKNPQKNVVVNSTIKLLKKKL